MAPSLDVLLSLEKAIWEALLAGDQAADAQLLDGSFLGVYPSGFADREDHVGELVDGPTIKSYRLVEERVLAISETAAMLSYRAEYRRAAADDGAPEEIMYVSSLWCLRDGGWLNVFSQDTPAAPLD